MLNMRHVVFNIVTACTVLTLLLVPIAGAQDTPDFKDTLEYLVGTWTTEYEYPGYGKIKEVNTYSWGADSNTLNIDIKVYSDGEQIDTGGGWMKYDPERNTIVSSINSDAMGSTYHTEEYKREGSKVWMRGTAENDPNMDTFELRMHTLDEDSFDWTMLVPMNGELGEIMTVTYHRMEK